MGLIRFSEPASQLLERMPLGYIDSERGWRNNPWKGSTSMLCHNDNITDSVVKISTPTRKIRQVKGLSQMAAKAAYATDNQEILGYCESEPQLYQ